MRLASLFLSIFFCSQTLADSGTANTDYEDKNWGVAFLIRHAEIAFDTETDSVSSVVPMMFYQGEDFFLRGIEGGAHLYKKDDWQLNAIGRMRFFDIPQEYQNAVQGDSVDFGMQWRKEYQADTTIDLEILSDLDGRIYGNVAHNWHFQFDDLALWPSISAKFKSADFNSQYYALEALTQESIGAGIEFNAKVEARYHVGSNFYLLSSIGVTGLDNEAYQSFAVSQRWNAEAYIGFGIFNNVKTAKKKNKTNNGYVRIAHGWATPSDIGEVLRLDWEKDEHNNQLSSVFYGFPLTDSLFELPISVYFTPGAIWHWKSDVQKSEQEYVLAVKAYYNFSWPTKWRIGAAEGLSYVSDVTYIERAEMEAKGYRPSNLMNYLDISFDVNIGDLFNARSLDKAWLGWSVHHRSSIFESSSQFGRIKGGSNYNSIYLQIDF